MFNGKTTFAKSKASESNSIYLSFDKMIHEDVQEKYKYQFDSFEEQFNIFLTNLVELTKKGGNYVIDGWFSWEKGWETKDFEDGKYLDLVQEQTGAEIFIIYVFLPIKESHRRFQEAKKKKIDNGYKEELQENDYSWWNKLLIKRRDKMIKYADVFICPCADNKYYGEKRFISLLKRENVV